MRCAACGSDELRAGSTDWRLEIAGIHFTAGLRAKICPDCGESYVDSSELERFELLAARWLADDGARSGDAFRFMRKALGLRAVELAELLDSSPETISRWEHGKLQPVDARAFALLGAMAADRLAGHNDTRSRLEALRSPSKVPNTVSLEVA